MKRILAFVCLFCPLFAYGQAGVAAGTPTITNTRGEPVPYAKVAVCGTFPGVAPDTPCNGDSNLSTIYTDQTEGTSCSISSSITTGRISGTGCTNPGKSDGLGNVVAFAVPGFYWCHYYGGSLIQPRVIPCIFTSGSGSGGGATFNCVTALNGSGVFATSSTGLSCDPLIGTDFLGHHFAQSYQALGPHNGEVWLTSDGVVSPDALPAGTVGLVVPNVVPLQYRFNFPPAPCTDGQVYQQLSHSTDISGTVNVFSNCLTIAGGLITFQTNSVNNSNQTLLNFLNSSANCGFTVTASNTSGGIEQLGFSGSTLTGTCLPAQYRKLRCETGLGDGLNAMTAGTYLQYFCVNDSGVTWTITGIHCWTDNAGTSTLNAANNAATALLTGAVTCNNTKASGGAAGTQSGTTTLASGDAVSFTFVADGTSKQTTWTVSMTQ